MDWQGLLLATLLATVVIRTHADANSFFSSLGDTFKNAGQTIAQGTQNAYGIAKNDTINAAQATGTPSFLTHAFSLKSVSVHHTLPRD